MQPSAIGYPKINEFSLLQEGKIEDHFFEFRKSTNSEMGIDWALYVFSKERTAQPLIVVTYQSVQSSSNSSGIILLYVHSGPEMIFSYKNLSAAEFLNKALVLVHEQIDEPAEKTKVLQHQPISHCPLYAEAQMLDYGALELFRYELFRVHRSAGMLKYRYLMYFYEVGTSDPVFVVGLEQEGERADYLTVFYGNNWSSYGARPDLRGHAEFLDSALEIARDYLINNSPNRFESETSNSRLLEAYGYDEKRVLQTLSMNQCYTRLLLATMIFCISDIPFLLSDLAYVGGLFLGLFYIIFILGTWVWLEGVRRQNWYWRSTIIIPAMLPIVISMDGGFLFFVMMSLLLLFPLHRRLKRTGLATTWLGISRHDLSILHMRQQQTQR